MSRLKWRSTYPSEGKRDPGAGVLHWEPRDPPPVTHILWTKLSQPEDVRSEAATEGKKLVIRIIGHVFAEGLHRHVAEKVVLSLDARSESAVPWD
jgi:hypothetical protein